MTAKPAVRRVRGSITGYSPSNWAFTVYIPFAGVLFSLFCRLPGNLTQDAKKPEHRAAQRNIHNMRSLLPGSVRLLSLVLLSIPSALLAQSSSGEIRLQINDSSGAAMQASGTLRNSATGVSRNFQTDAKGAFDFTGLTFGRYRLQVSHNGFNTESVSIEVPSATPVAHTVTMTIGAQSAQVDVVASTPLAGSDLSAE